MSYKIACHSVCCFIVGGDVVPGVREVVVHVESSRPGVRAVVPVTAYYHTSLNVYHRAFARGTPPCNPQNR